MGGMPANPGMNVSAPGGMPNMMMGAPPMMMPGGVMMQPVPMQAQPISQVQSASNRMNPTPSRTCQTHPPNQIVFESNNSEFCDVCFSKLEEQQQLQKSQEKGDAPDGAAPNGDGEEVEAENGEDQAEENPGDENRFVHGISP